MLFECWFTSLQLWNNEVCYLSTCRRPVETTQPPSSFHLKEKQNRMTYKSFKNISDHTMYRYAQWKRVSTKNLLQSKTGITEQKKAGKALCISKVLYLHWNKKIIKKKKQQTKSSLEVEMLLSHMKYFFCSFKKEFELHKHCSMGPKCKNRKK